MNGIEDYMAGRVDADTAVNREALRYAVTRRITCPQSGAVLDVRTAVYFRIAAPGGATGGEVVTGEVWDGPYGQRIREVADAGRVEITELLDGRVLFAEPSAEPRTYPYVDAEGQHRWACCDSEIGPVCPHRQGR